ncbi:MAG: hypothetical protein RLZZ385_409 [Pseudomonadota bacterium]|jgi:CubicO group peptidase (beta-lactamase class C family)
MGTAKLSQNLCLCLTLGLTLLTAASAHGQSLYFPAADDHWETVTPEQAGFRSAGVEQALAVAAARHSSAVVMLHNGRIMAEAYWQPANPPAGYSNFVQGQDQAGRVIEDVASAQKSVAAVITGIAQEKGLLTIDDPVTQYLGAGWSQADGAQEAAITLRHLLTMTSGLATDMGYAAPAGSAWLYNTPAYHTLMRVVETATGKDRNTVTTEWISGPMAMPNTRWTARPWADAAIGTGLATTARELARFGLMIQAGGFWQERQIIADQNFLQEMLQPSQTLNPAYGYLWWLNGQEFALGAGAQATRTEGPLIAAAPADLMAMQGAHDRKLYIVPSLGLVITRLGAAGGDDSSSFNDAFWQALMAARN